jgi:hypothetical protein
MAKALPSLAEHATTAGSTTMRDAAPTDWSSSPLPLDATAGTEAHVDVRLRSHGDDAWRRDHLACTVWSAELPGFAGTIDSVVHKALRFARL